MKDRIKKILSLLIVTLSVLLLFMPWVSFDEDELKEYFDISSSKTGLAYESEVDSYFKDVKAIIEESTDVKISNSKIKKAAKVFYDFKISPSEMDTYSSIMAGPYRKYAKYLDEDYFGHSDRVDRMFETNYIAEIIDKARAYSLSFTIFRIIYLLTWAAFALYAINVFTGKFDIFKYLFFIMRIIMVGAAIVALIINDNEVIFEVTASLTLWPFLALILAVPDAIYMPLVDRLLGNKQLAAVFTNAGNTIRESLDKAPAEKAAGSAEIVNDAGWTCPNCGMANSSDSRFCAGCGIANPFIVKCPGCGKELRDHEKFCPDCGTTITWIETEITCPNCGTKNNLESVFCENCGTRLKD